MSEGKNPTSLQKATNAVRSFHWASLAPYSLVIGIVSLFAGLIILLIRGDSGVDASIYIPLAIGVVGILCFGLLDPGRLQNWLGSRQARYGVNVVIMTLALMGILIVVNYIVYQESGRRTLWVDLTENKSNSLTPETVKTLQTLTQDVEARAYFTASSYSWDTTLPLLDKYKSQSGGKFTYVRIDPDASPLQAKEDGVTRDGTIVMQAGERTEQVTTLSEQEVTTALIRLETGENAVYFLTGHGEAGSANSENTGMNQAVSSLERKSYKVSPLDLRAQTSVPEDAKVLVIAGPKQPLLSAELTAIQDYLGRGGSLVLMQNPYPLTEMTPATDILGAYLSTNWGITLQNDVIFDQISSLPLIAVSSAIGTSPITENIQYYMLFPTAQSVLLTPLSGKTLEETSLVTVGTLGPQAWGETDFSEIDTFTIGEGLTATYDQDSDHAAPLSVAVSVEDYAVEARVVVFGDEDFAENQFIDTYANRDLFLNAVNWASKQEKLIDLTQYEATNRVILIPEPWVSRAITVVSAILLPASFIVAGVIVWFNRRKHK
jgi:ABC-type uncharacterized transport system involved in gliding motility auxiliary subunit